MFMGQQLIGERGEEMANNGLWEPGEIESRRTPEDGSRA